MPDDPRSRPGHSYGNVKITTRSTYGENLQATRRHLKLSQTEFAVTYGLDATTLRNWEQNRRKPDKAVRSFLAIIALDPEGIAALVRQAKKRGDL